MIAHIRALTASRGAMTFGVQMFGMALGAAAQLVLGRMLGPESYGHYVQGFALLAVLGLAAILGLKTASQRFIPEYQETGNHRGLRGFVRWAILLVLAAGCGVAVIGNGILGALIDDPGARLIARLVLWAVPIYGAMALLGAMLRAFGHPVLSVALGRPLREAGVLVTMLGLILVGTPTAAGLLGGMIAALAVSALISGWMVRAELARSPGPVGRFEPEWLRRSLPMMAVNLGNQMLRRADILMVGALAGSGAAGIYGICVFLTELLAIPLQTIGILFAPDAARFSARRDMPGLQRYVRRMARLSGGFAVILMLPLLIWAEPLLALVGPDYVAGAPALRILVIGQVIRAGFGNVNLLTMMTGAERGAAKVLALVVALAVAGHVALVPAHGVTGAALATAGAMTLYAALLAALAIRKTGIRPGPI